MRVFMQFPEGRTKALTLSYDDGVVQDARMIALLNENGIKCTFNLNSGLYPPPDRVFPAGEHNRKMPKDQATALYSDSGHEVAMHGLTHAFLDKLPADCALYEILEDRKNLEKQFHRPVRGLAYAWGTYSDTVVEMAKKAGVSYARTTDTSESFGIPEDWLRWHPTCHHAHPRLMEFAEQMVTGTPKNDPYNHTPWLFCVWGHAYEFDAWGSWELIEKFARYIGKREDIWYATNGQVHDYAEAYRHLVWTLEGDAVYNPTSLPVWFEAMEYANYTFKTYCVQPGELLRLQE